QACREKDVRLSRQPSLELVLLEKPDPTQLRFHAELSRELLEPGDIAPAGHSHVRAPEAVRGAIKLEHGTDSSGSEQRESDQRRMQVFLLGNASGVNELARAPATRPSPGRAPGLKKRKWEDVRARPLVVALHRQAVPFAGDEKPVLRAK